MSLFPCFMLEHGVRIPALMSCSGSVWAPCRGSDTHAPCSVLLCERVACVTFSVHVSFILFCVARGSCSATCFSHFLVLLPAVHVFYRMRAFMLCFVLCCVGYSLCSSLAACFHVVMSCVSIVISCVFYGW